MKHFLLFCFLIFFGTLSFAQNTTTDTSATCVAYWKKSDNKVFAITHTKEKLQDGKTQNKSVVSYEAHVTVLDSTEKGYTLQWTHKNYQSEGVDNQVLEMTNALLEGLTMIYKTDEVGMFEELVNWEEVRDFWVETAKRGIKKDDPTAQAVMQRVIGMFESKESVEATLIREIKLYHAPFGVEYLLDGQTTETLLHNITGGEPFPAEFHIKLAKINTSSGTCAIEMVQTLDKVKGRSILIDMLQRLAPAAFKKEEMEKEIKNLDMTDSHQYTLDLETGWLSKTFLKRVVNIGAAGNVETYTITDKSRPSL